jgi:hypothetical protein
MEKINKEVGKRRFRERKVGLKRKEFGNEKPR